MSDDAPLWEPQAWDSNASYKAFKYYLEADVGNGRLIRAYRQYRRDMGAKSEPKKVSGSWSCWARGCSSTSGETIVGAISWEERAKAYDAYLANKELEALARERAQNKAQRLKMIKGAQANLLILLSRLDFRPQRTVDGRIIEPELPKFSDIINALRILNGEARIEYNDLPEQKVQHSTKDGRPLQTIEQTVTNIGFDFSNYDDDDIDRLIQQYESLQEGAVSRSANGEATAQADADTPTADTSQEG